MRAMETNKNTPANDPPVVPGTSTNSSLPILEVFRSGDHTTSAGDRLTYSTGDLDAIVGAYDAANAPTPIVVGHPKTDDPAYGQIAAFKRIGNKLVAEPTNVDAAFAALVKGGKYNKISIAFFPPKHPSNPKPGVWYPRHVGFLGAAAPAVTGLKPVTFASDEGVVEFSTPSPVSGWQFSRFAQRFRDWLLEKFGSEEADKVLTDYDVASMIETATRADELNNTHPSFNAPPVEVPVQPPKESTTMSEQDTQELARLRTENASLIAQKEKQEADARKAEFSAMADKLVTEGRLLPADKEGFIAFAVALPATDGTVEFAAGDGVQTKTSALQWFKGFASRLPVQVPQGEAAKAPATTPLPAAEFVSAPGMTVDAESLALHNKAVEYAAANNIEYFDAVKILGGQ